MPDYRLASETCPAARLTLCWYCGQVTTRMRYGNRGTLLGQSQRGQITLTGNADSGTEIGCRTRLAGSWGWTENAWPPRCGSPSSSHAAP